MSRPPVREVDSITKGLNYDFVDLRIAGERVKTRLAATQQKRYVGLSNTDELGKNEGMLFKYPEEDRHRLVMRNMDFALDVIHVGADGRVNKWESMSESGEAVEGISKFAIELPHGWCEDHGVEKGDPVHLLDPPEEKQKLLKARRYVDDPNEVPEQYEVQEGPQGGLYYETHGDDAEEEEDTDDSEERNVLPQGENIVYEVPGEGQVVGEVDMVFEDKVRVWADDGNGWEMVPHEDVIGLEEELVGGGEDLLDDLTGEIVRLDTGHTAYVLDGEGEQLHIEMLDGPDAGEDIYGVTRDEWVEEITSDRVPPEPPEEYVEVPEAEDARDLNDWVEENAYMHQDLQVYDRASGETRDAFISETTMLPSEGLSSAEVQVIGGDKESFKLGDSNRFEVIGGEEFDSLTDEQKHDAIVKEFQEGEFKKIDRDTENKIQFNFFGRDYDFEGSLSNAKDWEVQRDVIQRMNYMMNEVRRASCGGRRGSQKWKMKVSNLEEDSTIAHELGHAIAVSYGYDYDEENATDMFGAYDLSHNYTDYSDTGDWDGFIDWDFSEGSGFNDPEEYMFTLWDHDGEVDKYAVGADEFKDEVEQEVQEEYGRPADRIREEWENRDFENISAEPKGVDTLINHLGAQEGDIIEVEVPDWDAGRDEDNNPVEFKKDYAKIKGWKSGDGAKEEPAEAEEGDEVRYFDSDGEQHIGEVQRAEVRDDGTVVMNVEPKITPTSGTDSDGLISVTTNSDDRFGDFDDFMGGEEIEQLKLERANGDDWSWWVNDGKLDSSYGSHITGYAEASETPEVDDDEEEAGGGRPSPQEDADTLSGQLASRWDGFNASAETPEAKMENLMRAVNRSWYKQAKVHETTGDAVDRQKVVMESGYSATNAHETMAQLHEVMQTPTDSNKQRAEDIFDEHPWLVLAYMDLWEPDPGILEEMQGLLESLGVDL